MSLLQFALQYIESLEAESTRTQLITTASHARRRSRLRDQRAQQVGSHVSMTSFVDAPTLRRLGPGVQ